MIVIPAIDIINGKCVRLTQGDYNQCKQYSDNPLDVAKRFEDTGFKRLHLVDLDGAKSKTVVNIQVLESICKNTSLSVDFGGGIKSDADIEKVFNAGACFACIGSIVQTDTDKTCKWLDMYGGNRFIIGADVRGEHVCINGWRETTSTTIFELVDNYKEKIHYLMCTDVSKDGMLQGASVDLYAKLVKYYPQLNIIASGGVGSMGDLTELNKLGLYAAIVGKAIYEGLIGLNELKNYTE